MEQSSPPHELIVAYVADTLGRRREAFGTELVDDLFRKIVLGVTDQLSAYLQCCTGARLAIGEVTLRHGRTRAYLIAQLSDRAGPLRLREAMRRWDIMATDSESTLVFDVNGRRWNFIDRYLHRLLEPLLIKLSDKVALYYRMHPNAKRTAGIIRFMEDVHRTVLVAEFDERADIQFGKADEVNRYYLQ